MNSTFYRHPFQGNLSEEQKIKVYERSTPSVSTHWHDFYELELILEGTGTMNVNGTEHPLAPNTLYLLTPTDLHSYHVEPGQELTLINITFSPNCIQDLTITEMITLTQYIFTKLDDRTAARMIFLMRQMKEECSGEGFLHKKYTTGLMSCILVELLRCYKKEQTTSQIPEMRSLPLPERPLLHPAAFSGKYNPKRGSTTFRVFRALYEQTFSPQFRHGFQGVSDLPAAGSCQTTPAVFRGFCHRHRLLLRF